MLHVLLDPDGTLAFGVVLIISSKTGVAYSAQCGGTSNELRTIEGFLIPVGGTDLADAIYGWFWNRFRGNCHQSNVEWNAKLMNELAEIVATIPCWKTNLDGHDERGRLKLDENRIQECIEAWIPVSTPYGNGILTLKNSD